MEKINKDGARGNIKTEYDDYYGNLVNELVEKHREILTETMKEMTEIKEQERSRLIREIKERFINFHKNQIDLYGKLPFVVFEGKADEKEKITIYEQALKDLLQELEGREKR